QQERVRRRTLAVEHGDVTRSRIDANDVSVLEMVERIAEEVRIGLPGGGLRSLSDETGTEAAAVFVPSIREEDLPRARGDGKLGNAADPTDERRLGDAGQRVKDAAVKLDRHRSHPPEENLARDRVALEALKDATNDAHLLRTEGAERLVSDDVAGDGTMKRRIGSAP